MRVAHHGPAETGVLQMKVVDQLSCRDTFRVLEHAPGAGKVILPLLEPVPSARLLALSRLTGVPVGRESESNLIENEHRTREEAPAVLIDPGLRIVAEQVPFRIEIIDPFKHLGDGIVDESGITSHSASDSSRDTPEGFKSAEIVFDREVYQAIQRDSALGNTEKPTHVGGRKGDSGDDQPLNTPVADQDIRSSPENGHGKTSFLRPSKKCSQLLQIPRAGQIISLATGSERT